MVAGTVSFRSWGWPHWSVESFVCVSYFLFLFGKQKVELLHFTYICATIKSVEHVLKLAFYLLNRSEGPGQVFVLTIKYLLERLKDVPESEYEHSLLSYDNMCNLCKLKASQKPLPLPRPYDQMWLKISKIIDGLHIRNHKNPDCLQKYCPDPWKEKFPALNTPVAEQTFSWASKFKKNLCAMPKRRFLFFYHRMVVRRNQYISHCYGNNRQPVMPKVR